MTTREPVQHMADVIREAVTCTRAQCTEEQHQRFVVENMQIAAQNTTTQATTNRQA